MKPRVLVVEDCVESIESLVASLGSDYEVCFALGGEEALELVDSMRGELDLILLDIMLPGLDGYAVLQRLRAETSSREIPVIFITGRGEEEAEARAFELGAVDYITKPFSAPIVRARVKTHSERRQLDRRIRQAQKLESLGVLAGGIAHDFNNLLVGVLGYADLALRRLSDRSAARPMVEQIKRAGENAAELCDQLLAYSGQGRFVVQALDLNEVILEIRHLLEISVAKKALLSFDLTEGLPAVVADAAQLRQILMNLVVNASEAIAEAGGVIRVATGTIFCDSQSLEKGYIGAGDAEEGSFVFLEVTDSGGGMDRATVDRIFDPFFTTKFTGRGLGLAAVLGIAKGHRGAVKVVSQPGSGTSFKILMPVSCEAPQARSAEGSGGEWRGQGRVLLVDDDATVLGVAEAMLQELGYTVVKAADGVEALERFRQSEAKFACVLLDLMMPQMDGEETFRELRRLGCEAPILLSSGYNEEQVLGRVSGDGRVGFLKKPYQSTALIQGLRELLEG